jgi:F420-non-reducing hydrogenase large subunit
MPVLTSRICGICPEAHHLASVKALDVIFGVEPPPAAKKVRELLYMAFFVSDHATHFFALGGPDIILGGLASPQDLNLFGVIAKLGRDAGMRFIECRKRNHAVLQMLGGRGIHTVAGIPGGWSKQVTSDEAALVRNAALLNIEFALFTLDLFERIVLKDPQFSEMLYDETYLHKTYSMGMVDERNRPNFYDGMMRIVDPDGNEFARYHPRDYARHIAEHVEPWTYLKFPYLRAIGWRGLQDGVSSGVYCATPLARLNVSAGMATPQAQEQYERMYDAFGSRGAGLVHHRMATHWARLIELLYAAERMYELACDSEITSDRIRNIPKGRLKPSGIGCIEAPRGTLTHHYSVDQKGVITKVNIISGTTNNHAPIAMSIKRAAERFIKKGTIIDKGLLNKIEMAFRLYDPCLACATHAQGNALHLIIRDSGGQIIRAIGL